MEVGQSDSDKQASKQTSCRTNPGGQMRHGACRLRPLRRNGNASYARAQMCLYRDGPRTFEASSPPCFRLVLQLEHGVAARFAQNRTLTPINDQPGVPAASAAS